MCRLRVGILIFLFPKYEVSLLYAIGVVEYTPWSGWLADTRHILEASFCNFGWPALGSCLLSLKVEAGYHVPLLMLRQQWTSPYHVSALLPPAPPPLPPLLPSPTNMMQLLYSPCRMCAAGPSA